MGGKRSIAAVLLTLLLVTAAGRAEVTIQDPGTFVVDRANIIRPEILPFTMPW